MDRLDEGALSVRAAPMKDEQALFSGIAGQRIGKRPGMALKAKLSRL